MPNRDLIVVAASAGGLEPLQQVLGGLPPDLAASVLVVVHMPPSGGDALRRILDRSTPLEVRTAADGEALRPGCVYVCVGDRHLLAGNGHVHVRNGPRENGHRPAADPLFRSAAAYYGPRAIGVVLSGSLSDGTAGLQAIRSRGGVAVVQDPDEALYDSMPRSALEYVGADHVVAAQEIGPLLTRLVAEEVDGSDDEPGPVMRREVAFMEGDDQQLEQEHPGRPSPWPCPDCHGVLWEIDDGPVIRFRCRIGHAWVADSLLQEQGAGVEAALWTAIRALEDRIALSETLAERAEEQGRRLSAARFREDLADMARSLEVLRRLVHGQPVDVAAEQEAPHGAGPGDE